MEAIKRKLTNIPTEHKPAPFWSWNDELKPEELKRQVRWMHEKGIGGFFMHARGGLKTSYMSDKWMECIEACCDEANALGMDAWGYDENGWPSGFADGKLLEKEENRDRYIEWETGEYDPKADISYLVTSDEIIRVTQSRGEQEYLNLYIGRSVSTVDVLNPDVVRQFIELTHEKYKEYFGDKFSEKMKGFFTDEPQFYRGGGIPYSSMLESYFRKHYNKDIYDELGLLFVEKGEWRTFRYRYWLAMHTLIVDSFAKQVYNWCEENEMQFTGHYIIEDMIGPQMLTCGGIMPLYAYMHMPGIDWLGRDTELELGPRQVGSVAKQMGKERVLTETFAGCDWNCSPEEFRRIAGFQYANGVNVMCHHLLPYSEHGQRKRDYPAHFSSINPWIEDGFKEFNDYFTKLGYLLSQGEETIKVAMLHPIRSAYFENLQGKGYEGFSMDELEEKLRLAMRTLSSRGISFHFLDETLLSDYGFVIDNQIGCGKCSYEYLVFPHILTMGRETEKLVREFVNNGGKILLLDEKPQYLEGKPFHYDYLKSNCSIEELIKEQPFQVTETENKLYYAYREIEGNPFLFIQNASHKETYVQTFKFADGSSSFVKFDPVTFDSELIPLSITVHENESLLLFPVEEETKPSVTLEEAEFKFRNAEVEFKNNYFVIDEVCYSRDGINYSQPIYVNELYQQLLQERYDGRLWIRYGFEVEMLPDVLELIVEKDNAVNGMVNGHSVVFQENWENDSTFFKTDIQPFVQLGANYYETVVDWKQSEATYYALFGENVTETLKNCICYEGEIEAVYLRGSFGVYSHAEMEDYDNNTVCGHDFYIGVMPKKISEPTTDGMPFFRGEFKVGQNIMLDKTNVLLHVMGKFLQANVWVNGEYAGKLFFEKRIDISKYAKSGENQIEVEYMVGNYNLFGPLHHGHIDWLVCPWHFDDINVPKLEDGRNNYRLHRFYA